MSLQPRARTRQTTRNATKFDVRLHVKNTIKMNINTKVAYGNFIELPVLQSLDLFDTSVCDILDKIDLDVIPSTAFKRQFGGVRYLNACVGMKGWKKKVVNGKLTEKLLKSDPFDIRTELDSDIDEEQIVAKINWIEHVQENGEKKADGNFIVDIGIVVFSKKIETTGIASLPLAPPTMATTNDPPSPINSILLTTIVNNKRLNDDSFSAITTSTTPGLTSSSSKKKARTIKKNIRFIAPKKLRICIVHPINYNTTKGTYETEFSNSVSSFYVDFDDFVEYRFDDQEDGWLRNISDEILEEDQLSSHLLQPLKHLVGHFIYNDEISKRFYDGKIGMNSGLFLSFNAQKRREMIKLQRSTDVDKFIRDATLD